MIDTWKELERYRPDLVRREANLAALMADPATAEDMREYADRRAQELSLTLDDLVGLEPRLGQLLALVGAKLYGRSWNPVWRAIKPEINSLVGGYRRDGHPVLRTVRAWNLAEASLKDAFFQR